MLLPFTKLGQRDNRWGKSKLGSSNTTISGYGCTITSISSALSLNSPVIANDAILSVNGFANGNLVIWEKLPSAFPRIKEVERVRGWSSNAVEIIKTFIDKGDYALIEVDGKPIGGVKHWMLVYGYHDELMIWDPWYSETSPFKKWTPTGYTRLKITPLAIDEPIPMNNKKYEDAWRLIAKRMDLSVEEAIGQQAVEKYNESEKDRENKSEVIKQKENVIAKQSEVLIQREESMKQMTAHIQTLSDEAVVWSSKLEKCREGLDKVRYDYKSLDEMYKMSQKQGEKLKAEIDSLRKDKHLPTRPLLRKLCDILIALDDIKTSGK